MAGDWIKVEKSTAEKPEVLAISEFLGIHPTHAFGLCVKFWIWCDTQLLNGNAVSVTKVTLDYVTGQIGMTDALLNVGWLRDRSGSLEVPRFDRHLSEGSKNRALTKERVKKSKEKSNDQFVKKVTQAPLLEKRREEKSIITLTSNNTKARGALADLISYAVEIGLTESDGEAMYDHWTANGWKNGQSTSKDWKAGMRKWKAQGWHPSQKNAGKKQTESSGKAYAPRGYNEKLELP
jgi:hypothetical protein